MEYVSPIDGRAATQKAFAPRPETIAGAHVALLDITKARGDEFLDRVEHLLRARGAETFRISKETFSRPASADVIEEIAIHGDLAVEGLAD
jgi:alpha-galactosidase/6-phospho-beta-glucosidase family protein